MILVFLTCANRKEARKIAKELLEKKLVACAKTIPVSSQFLWKSKRERANEALLLLETLEKHFAEIEEVVKSLHSYETPVMFAIPVGKTSKDVQEWLKNEIG